MSTVIAWISTGVHNPCIAYSCFLSAQFPVCVEEHEPNDHEYHEDGSAYTGSKAHPIHEPERGQAHENVFPGHEGGIDTVAVTGVGFGVGVDGPDQGQTGGGVAGGCPEAHAGFFKPFFLGEFPGTEQYQGYGEGGEYHTVDGQRSRIGGDKLQVQGGHGREHHQFQKEPGQQFDGFQIHKFFQVEPFNEPPHHRTAYHAVEHAGQMQGLKSREGIQDTENLLADEQGPHQPSELQAQMVDTDGSGHGAPYGFPLVRRESPAVEIIRLFGGFFHIGAPAFPYPVVHQCHPYGHGYDQPYGGQHHGYGHMAFEAQLFKGSSSSGCGAMAAVEGEHPQDSPAHRKAGPELVQQAPQQGPHAHLHAVGGHGQTHIIQIGMEHFSVEADPEHQGHHDDVDQNPGDAAQDLGHGDQAQTLLAQSQHHQAPNQGSRQEQFLEGFYEFPDKEPQQDEHAHGSHHIH